MTHQDTRIAIGALALGALDDDEATEVRAHLTTCSECQREYDELRGVPALLGLIPVGEVIAGPPVASQAGSDRLLNQVVAERKAKVRRGYVSRFAGALALAAAAAVIGFVVAEQSAPEVPPADFTLAAEDGATGVWAEVELNEVGWGTKIELHMTGATAGETCRLVAVTIAGGEEVASTWQVPVGDYMSVPGAVGAEVGEIDHFDVITSGDELLVRITL